MQSSLFRPAAAVAAVVLATAAQSASAYAIFNSTADRFGFNYDISADIPTWSSTRVIWTSSVNGPEDDIHVDVFDGQNGTGSKLFSGTLTTLRTQEFTDATMMDGLFSAVASFAGTQLPVSGPTPPGGEPPRSYFLSLKAGSRGGPNGGAPYLVETSTFEPPAATAAATVPEPGTLGITALAGALLVAVRRRIARR